MGTPTNPMQRLGHSLMLLAAARGVPMERLLAAAGLSGEDLLSPGARLSEAAVLSSLRLLERMTPGENVALPLSRSVPTALFGPLDWFVRRAPDLGTLFELLIEHGDLLSDRMTFGLERGRDEAAFRVHHPFDDEDGGAGAELAFGAGLRAVREHFEVTLLRVEFRHAPRGPESAYVAHFGVPVHFGAAANRFVLPLGAVAAPNRAPVDAALLPHRIRQLRADMGASASDGLDDVRQAIAAGAAARDYSADGLARRLGTSLRALQRRLRESGTSARALLEEARHAEALRLLDEPRHSIAQVADALGFASERGFRKAFERWAGCSPSKYRRDGA